MNTSDLTGQRLIAFFLGSVCAVTLTLSIATAGEHAPKLPLKTSFGQGTPGENSGPYAVTLKNTSDQELTVTTTITFSVQSHNRPQFKTLPAQTIAAGGTWKIDDLAALDKVLVKAKGYAPLELIAEPATLPLAASFGQGTPGENSGPYAVTLKNTSDQELTVTATITFSVQSHNRPQFKALPAQTIAAGGAWKIDDLAAHDQILVKGEGYSPLKLTTPPGK